MKERGNLYTIILILILIASLILLILENVPVVTGDVSLTGYATAGSTFSNVSITSYFAIQMSGNLTAGIDFGSVQTTNFLDQNATQNWCHATNGTCTNVSSASPFNSSYYFLNVSLDSNTAVDFCTYANEALKDRTGWIETIGLSNETYTFTNWTTNITNFTLPPQQGQAAFTAGYVRTAMNISKGNSTYWRFFLDIPQGQASGTYNNTINFKGVQLLQTCT
jgi:hypothetical protein